MALEDRRQLAIEAGPSTPAPSAPPTRASARGWHRVSEEQRSEMMNEMARTERDPDPSRESRRGVNTDYAMDNGLTLRFHQGSSMWLELRSSVGTLGTLSRLDNALDGDKSTDILVRQRIYNLAKRLQPSNMDALAAIRDTITQETRRETPQATFPMTPPMTPRPGAPRTPFPYPMAAMPAAAAPQSPPAPGALAKSAARPSGPSGSGLRRSHSRSRGRRT